MPSSSGLLFSAFLGLVTRKLQVNIVGKVYPRSINRIPGYLLSVGAFVGGYLAFDSYVDLNRQLLERRLSALNEQRADRAAFLDLSIETQEEFRHVADKKAYFFELFDRYGAPYK